MRCRFTIGRVPPIRQRRLMSLIRRLTATLSSALLLQLTLLGTGTSRTMHTGATMDATAQAHAMSGMAEHVTVDKHESGWAVGRSDSSGPSHGLGGSSDGEGCCVLLSPGQCTSTTTCSLTAAPSTRAEWRVATSLRAPELPEPDLLQSGPRAAPELPPPRA